MLAQGLGLEAKGTGDPGASETFPAAAEQKQWDGWDLRKPSGLCALTNELVLSANCPALKDRLQRRGKSHHCALLRGDGRVAVGVASSVRETMKHCRISSSSQSVKSFRLV